MGVWDSIKSTAKEFLAGEVSKAIILVREDEEANPEPKEPVQPKSKSGFGGTNIGDASSSAFDAAKNVAESQVPDAIKSSASKVANGLAGKMTGVKGCINYNKEFEVQFNPSTLRISSQRYEDEDVTKVNSAGGAGDITRGANYPYMELHVTLVFERIVPNKAFIRDSAFSNASTAMYSASNSILKEWNPFGAFDNRSVQTMVEGFTAAIRKTNTRQVAFCWSTMMYEGILKNVRTNYTMFDVQGRPIRGEVAMTIQLSDTDVNSTNMGYWMEAYDAAFEYKESGVFGKVKGAMDTVGNVLDTVSTAATSIASTLQGITGLGLTIGGAIAGLASEKDTTPAYEKYKKQIIKKQEQRTKRAERNFKSGSVNDVKVSISDEKLKEFEEKRSMDRLIASNEARIERAKKIEDSATKGESYTETESEEVEREYNAAKKKEDEEKSQKSGNPDNSQNVHNDDQDSGNDSENKEKKDTRTDAEKAYDSAVEDYNKALEEENAVAATINKLEDDLEKEEAKLADLKTAEEKAKTEYETAQGEEKTAREASENAEKAESEAKEKVNQLKDDLNKMDENDPNRASTQAQYEAAKNDYTQKQEAAKTAKTELDKKEKVSKEKNQAVIDAHHAVNEQEVEVGKAKDDLDYAKYMLPTYEEKTDAAEKKVDEAYEKVEKEAEEAKKNSSINDIINNSGSGGIAEI